jgi:hypothetical protein
MNYITYQDCIDLYEYLYQKISRNENFTFRPRKVEKACIENFLKNTTHWGREALFNYLLFGFAKYEGLDTNRGKNNIPSQWVFGQKVFKEYQQRDSNKTMWVVDMMKKSYKISKVDVGLIDEVKINIHLLDSKERRRFQNRERRLVHCLENDLFDKESVDCMVCVNNKVCSKI